MNEVEQYLYDEMKILEQFAACLELFESQLWATLDNVLEQAERGYFERMLNGDKKKLDTWREIINFIRALRGLPARMKRDALEKAEQVRGVERHMRQEDEEEDFFERGLD